MKKTKLTNEKYWNKVWNGVERSILKKPYFEKDLINILNSNSVKKHMSKIIELGAAGRGSYIYILNKYFKYDSIYGLDFDIDSLENTQTILDSENIKLNIIHCDILNDQQLSKYKESFDIVSSFGLIEHFEKDDFEKILKNHFFLLKKGGLCIISVPNFNSPIYKFQWTLFMPFTLYGTHNLKILNRIYLTKKLSSFGDIIYSGYVGGIYEPPNLKIIGNIFNILNHFNIHKYKKIFYPSILLIVKKL